MKILYIISTLKRAGPVNQLLNIIKNLDSVQFEAYVITLSPEPKSSRWKEYINAGIKLKSLNLSRLQGIFKAKKLLLLQVDEIRPDIIHTQGIRPDILISKIQLNIPWFLTVRNYPFFDYPQKYGYLKGYLMAVNHIKAIKKCSNTVACSNTISKLLSKHVVRSKSIQNGVEIQKEYPVELSLSQPIFVTVGSLIPRKNTSFIIEAFNQYTQNHKTGNLIILGDGPQKQKLISISSERIHFKGNIPNVADYLFKCDFFLSASLSEGLPNTVLEALATGLPVLLSNIPSHYEISNECPNSSKIFHLKKGPKALAELMAQCDQIFSQNSRKEAKKVVESKFSANVMSQKYQNLYLSRTIKNEK